MTIKKLVALAPIWGERECEAAAANLAPRIRHGTNFEHQIWNGTVVGH